MGFVIIIVSPRPTNYGVFAKIGKRGRLQKPSFAIQRWGLFRFRVPAHPGAALGEPAKRRRVAVVAMLEQDLAERLNFALFNHEVAGVDPVDENGNRNVSVSALDLELGDWRPG